MKDLQKKIIPSAFTLAELIIVIVILAILATIGFVSISGYVSSSRDAKRVTNASTIAAGFDAAIASHYPVNTSKTATGYNISIVGSGLTMTGVHGVINSELLLSLKISGKDLASYDGFQEYRYSYFMNQGKYQILATLENPEYSKIGLTLPSFTDTAFAVEWGETGYPFIKGNFAETGGIMNIMVDGTTWNNTLPDPDGIRVFSWAEVLHSTDPIITAPPASVPVDASCGDDDGKDLVTMPTNLCTDGAASAVTNAGVGTPWAWTCTGINGGANVSCQANRAPGGCVFDDPDSKFDQCVFP